LFDTNRVMFARFRISVVIQITKKAT